jgi:glycogen debranching enzyme
VSLEIAVGPPRLCINQGHTVLVTEQDGGIDWPTDKGLYCLDTRLISSWKLYANGEPWDLLNSGAIAYYAAKVYLTNQPFKTESGDVPGGDLGLVLGRTLGEGLHEDLELVNHGRKAVRFNLEIVIRSDFADLFEVKANNIVRRGRITTQWSQRAARLTTRYENRDFVREVVIRVRDADPKPIYANGRISFDVELEPGGVWRACLLHDFGDGKKTSRAPRPCIDHCLDSVMARRLGDWQGKTLDIRASNEEFHRFFQQAVEDMAALRLPIEGTDHLEFVPAAGVPWFAGLFGRDSLIVSLQNGIIHPDFARGALEVLGRYQATKRDDYRDAEPGKIMHELRLGELAHFGLIPHTPYYGTADATPLYLIVLHNAWRCTGDRDLLERHLETAERCLEWIDHCGDRDGDGFQEYETRSSAGYENQGWKDSGEALVYPDGSLVKGPKALVELQGYVYDAWLRMAEVFDALGRRERAKALRRKARDLFERFNEVFWDEASGFYAFALDGDKKPVMTVASNPGQCLWSGIVAPERAGRVVRRLLEPDMWAGWGVRTLSALNPAFNPHSYQNGSVWPHDNALIALGMRRYGFVREAFAIARGLTDASSLFAGRQMPELFAGLDKSPTSFPVQYNGANVPQAWAAGSCFSLLQMIVGLQPHAPNGRLWIDPVLPDWMPELELQGLRLGRRSIDLHLWRDGDETRWTSRGGDASIIEPRSYADACALAGADANGPPPAARGVPLASAHQV